MKKSVVIIRGVSGSGKTTFARLIQDNYTEICCADDYFEDEEGNYNFDASKLNQAHEFCREQFKKACRNDLISKIIVANTNTSNWEFEWYEKTAKDFRFDVFHVVIENRHGCEDIHGVPDPVKQKQKDRLLRSIEL